MNRTDVDSERARANHEVRSPDRPFERFNAFLKGSYHMRLVGRIEKRVPRAVSVYLISLKDPRAAEHVLTENVSSNGARVITKQRCQPGEQHQITSLSGEFRLSARVIVAVFDLLHWNHYGSAFVFNQEHYEFRWFGLAGVSPDDVNIRGTFVEGLTRCQRHFFSAPHLHHD